MRTALLALIAVVAVAITLPFQGCGDNDDSVALPCCPACGDGVCGGDETGCNCDDDCGDGPVTCTADIPECGDGACDTLANRGESHESCPRDCPLACRRCGEFEVHTGHHVFRGDACPSETEFAYRDGTFLVCHSCTNAADCSDGAPCLTVCGPGCENDAGGCCGVRRCVDGL
jgi:hypothetical protein